MTARTLIRTRSTRALALAALSTLALAALALAAVAPSSTAASGPLTVTPVTWDVVGLDSNNVNSGPNVFPVGMRVCNTGSDAATNVVATWSWKTSQNAFTGPADGTTVSVGTMAAGLCRQVFFEVTLNRSPSSRLKSRDYQITVTADGGLTASTAQRQLYVEKLVSQNRNATKKLAGPGGCNLSYTVCDAAPTSVVVGRTYTYKVYAETSTAYQQLETFVNFPASVVEVVSTSATYSNPSGAAASSIYADACGWSTTPTTRSCVGPATIPGGKAGGRIVVTYVLRAIAPGSGALKATIYDFSGSSYHYNADHDAFALTSSPFTARYGLNATIDGNGKVTSAPGGTRSDGTSSGVDCGGTGVTCSVGYATGTSVTLTAQPLDGDAFVGWSGGGCSGAALTCTVTMSQSRSVTATFTGLTSHPLEVARAGSGRVTADVGALDCGATCETRYADATVVTLSATPSAGWAFGGWSGAGCSGTGTCQVTMSQARSVTATFTEQTYALGVSASGNGTVVSSPGTISCGNGNTFCSDVYGSGTVVTLTATPGSGQNFTGWSGDCLGAASTCTMTMSQARSAVATFSGAASYPLEVGVGGSGTGTVTSDVGGINCGATCSASFAEATLVTLTATPGSGSTLVRWGGDCSGASTTCAVTMSQARNVFATFGTPQTLTVTKAGSGAGTVTSNVGGIDCGATCSASIAEGTAVTLTASASTGSIFTGWSGDCSGTGACTVTMSAARTVTATFATAYTLSVTRTDSGTGTVTSDVEGIACGGTCSASYASGTVVALTASASPGSRFAGWAGGGCTGTGTCTVTMSAARAVSASFVARYPLAVTKAGSGSGSVAGAGIDCGATCTGDYDGGTEITLTATAAPGSRFTDWSGACSGSGACTVTMSAARTVTASFVAVHSLTVTKTGSGSGNVAGAGIDCGAICSRDYDDGTEVTLTATAAPGSSFTGWSGACSGTGACTLTMSAAREARAEFATVEAPGPAGTHTLTVTQAGSGSGVVTGTGIDCAGTCVATFDDGMAVVLTARPAHDSRFAGWSGGGCAGTETCHVTMTAARHVTATFVRLVPLRVAVDGRGRVVTRPDRIACRTACSLTYDVGRRVTLVARARPGHWFTGWSGACRGTAPRCAVTMSAARRVRAHFAPELQLRLRMTADPVYHLPYERAHIKGVATWRGRPLAGADVRLVVSCPQKRVATVLRTGPDGRAVFRFGSRMPNAMRVDTCRVTAHVAANGRSATSAGAGALRFIHPLWLERKRGDGRGIVVRVWGRGGEAVQLLADGRVVARARVGRHGWVELAPRGIRRGDRLSVRGRHGHHSHVLRA